MRGRRGGGYFDLFGAVLQTDIGVKKDSGIPECQSGGGYSYGNC